MLETTTKAVKRGITMKKSIKIPRKKVYRDCFNCINMLPIGEGDHICSVNPLIMVLEDYGPTEDYCFCNSEDWEER